MVDWKSAIISALCTGGMAGFSDFVTKQQIGESLTSAGIAAALTFLIVFFTTLKQSVNPTAAKSKSKKKPKFFLGQ